jgi:prepilin-type N-terminal cleavage/methylation domain-containing protein
MTKWHETILKAKQQLGFTLIELTIVLALVGLVGSAITMSIYQVYGINSSTLARVTAQNQVAFASKWITTDAQQAQNIVTSGPYGLPVQLKWQDWDTGHQTVITYSIVNNTLVRLAEEKDGNGVILSSNTSNVASYISSDGLETNCSFTQGPPPLFVFNIKANVIGPRTSSATALVTIIPKAAQVGTE